MKKIITFLVISISSLTALATTDSASPKYDFTDIDKFQQSVERQAALEGLTYGDMRRFSGERYGYETTTFYRLDQPFIAAFKKANKGKRPGPDEILAYLEKTMANKTVRELLNIPVKKKK